MLDNPCKVYEKESEYGRLVLKFWVGDHYYQFQCIEQHGITEIKFFLAHDPSVYKLLNNFHVAKIFATVKPHLAEWLTEFKPTQLFFTTSVIRPSVIKLYTRMANLIKNHTGMKHIETRHQYGVHYWLIT